MAIDLPEWKLYSLEMDDAGRKIGEFFEKEGYPIERANPGEGIADIEQFIPDCKRIIHKQAIEEAVAGCIKSDSRVMALYGHGGYHFFTYGLAMLANRLSDEFGYIHIDRHHDSWFDSNEQLSCGAFVRQILAYTHVHGYERNMLYIGANNVEAGGFSRAGMLGIHALRENSFEFEFHEKMPEYVYVTIDLDVMHREEVRTAFEREDLRLDEIKAILNRIKQKKRIISADVLGFTETNAPYTNMPYIFGQGIPSFEKSMGVYKEIADIIMEA